MKLVAKQGPGLKQLEFLLRGLKKTKKVGKVGWFKGARYDDANKTPVYKIAIIQEFGYAPLNIPPRAFMRPTMKEKSAAWAAQVSLGAKAILDGRQTIEGVLSLLAQRAAGDVEQTISNLTTPPLKPATIRARLRSRGKSSKAFVGGLDKPLIDTATMFDSLSYAVEKE